MREFPSFTGDLNAIDDWLHLPHKQIVGIAAQRKLPNAGTSVARIVFFPYIGGKPYSGEMADRMGGQFASLSQDSKMTGSRKLCEPVPANAGDLAGMTAI